MVALSDHMLSFVHAVPPIHVAVPECMRTPFLITAAHFRSNALAELLRWMGKPTMVAASAAGSAATTWVGGIDIDIVSFLAALRNCDPL